MNQFCRGWRQVAPGGHKHLPSGILGILCRVHWPEVVELGNREDLADTLDHYVTAFDQDDEEVVTGRIWTRLKHHRLARRCARQERREGGSPRAW
jgi:hypothetical protein